VWELFGLHAGLHADRHAAWHASWHAELHAGLHFMTPGMPGCMQQRIHLSILGCMHEGHFLFLESY